MIEAVFSYMALLKEVGPQERIFREIQKIEDTSFRFADEDSAVDLVEDLAEAMQFYPPEDYLTGSELYFDYVPEVVLLDIPFIHMWKLCGWNFFPGHRNDYEQSNAR